MVQLESSKSVAIVTGATSGMGKEFAFQIAKRNEVDEIWLIARREAELEKTAEELSIHAKCLTLDLSDPTSYAALKATLEERRPLVTYLVNAAGFGKFGDWKHIPDKSVSSMIELNARAVVELTRATLPYMQSGSHIIQLASCAAFTPLPHMNVYAASKVFVLNYTRGLRWELHGSGITATAVCPAWVKTGFEKVARDGGASNDVGHLLFAQQASTVVKRALLANRLHFAVATCGIMSFLLRIVGKFIPHCITMAGWEGIRRL